MICIVRAVQNLGSESIPVNRDYDDANVVSYGQFIDGGGNVGILKSQGRLGGTNNLGLMERALLNYATATRQSYSAVTEPPTAEERIAELEAIIEALLETP